MEFLQEYIDKHKEKQDRYMLLDNMYKGKHSILGQEKKELYKPDNRLVVNYAKYIVDTLNGFFIGVPLKVTHESDEVNDYLEFIDKFNNQDDNNSELSKLCSIYGHAYEMIYIDGDGDLGITYIDPRQAFVIYDNSIVGKPMYGIRFYDNVEGKLEGSYSDKDTIYYFHQSDDGLVVDEEVSHVFGDVPIIEYVENEERMGSFETVVTLIDAYNKAISEKANDVDYFSDAYLLILGAILDDEQLRNFRDNRIINMEGGDIEKLIVEFLEKPSADETQENLINRLEKLIFQMSMVMDINDENFGTQSGIALKYKLQSMENLAKTKERKFSAGLNKRYKMIANTNLTPIKGDEWAKIDYQFTRNYPANLLEESEIAKNLTGITSEETAISVLSNVSNAREEVEKKNEAYDNEFTRVEEVDIDEEDNE